MYSTYNSSLEKNQMMTPPTIGLTSSIVNDKLSNITLEDNSSGLFAMNEDKSAIQTKDGVPLEASQFKITSSNTEINNDDKNAVNKSYCDSNYIRDGASTVTFGGLNIKSNAYENKYIFEILKNTGQDVVSLRIKDSTGQALILNTNHLYANGFSLLGTKFINFNTNYLGNQHKTEYPQGKLTNIVPSDITADQITNLINDNLLDNVCPTYQFTENTYLKGTVADSIYLKNTVAESTYAKKSEIFTNLAWNTFSVYTTDGDDLKTQLTNVSMKMGGSHITIPIPTTINSTILIMSVNFTVRSTNKNALNALGCTLNSLPGSITSQAETATRASVFSGYTTKGTCIRTTSPYEYKFSLICPFSTTINNKVYLHFFFDDNVNYTANNEVYILATKTEPQVNVTIFGI